MMFKRVLEKYIDLIKRLDPREDDVIIVERFDRFTDILRPNEKILWQAHPSPHHAWSDHDQLEPAGSVGDRPVSLTGRRVESILAACFILFLFLAGTISVYSGIDEILKKPYSDAVVPSVFLILVGITLMSGLPFLLRPFSNCLRARQITYLLTTTRAMIVRRGHALAEIWLRSPVIISISLLFLYSTAMFFWFFAASTYQDIVQGAGLSTWLARGSLFIFMSYLGFILVAFGYIGLRFQSVIILEAIKDRHSIFTRSFDFDKIRRNDFPVVSRLRKDGFGDVILDRDGHWEYHGDSNISPDFKINAVGFLSVPEAKKVSDKIKQVVAS